MIFELIFNILFGLPNLLLSFLPSVDYQNINELGKIFTDFLSIGLFFCGAAPFALVISSVILWMFPDFAFGIFEWVYSKIPFKFT